MTKIYSIVLLSFAWMLLPTKPATAVRLIESPYSYQKTIENIKTAIASNNFKIVREKSNSSSHTLYFCNFHIAHKIIGKDKRVGVLLPCKIKIIKNNTKTFVATLNVDALVKQTGINIGSLCKKIKTSIDTILEEAMI